MITIITIVCSYFANLTLNKSNVSLSVRKQYNINIDIDNVNIYKYVCRETTRCALLGHALCYWVQGHAFLNTFLK